MSFKILKLIKMSIILSEHSKSYLLDIINGEHIEEAYERLWKIIQHHPIDQYQYEQLIIISKMWYYKRHLNCSYSEHNEKLISYF
jgi:hypothetical protein